MQLPFWSVPRKTLKPNVTFPVIELNRAGYGSQTETINHAAVKLAKEIAGDKALVAGSVSRTQLIEREGIGALDKAGDHLAEQIRLLKDAGVDFLILETFFHLAEMKVALAAEVLILIFAYTCLRPGNPTI